MFLINTEKCSCGHSWWLYCIELLLYNLAKYRYRFVEFGSCLQLSGQNIGVELEILGSIAAYIRGFFIHILSLSLFSF